MDKRDGSHWELFNCPVEKHEGTHTVQAVCTDTSSQSNCHDVFQDGVAYTVVEMPDGCGPGSYAMAVSLKRSANFTKLPHHLEKRSGVDPRVYDFTFDYDFTAVNKRASTSKSLPPRSKAQVGCNLSGLGATCQRPKKNIKLAPKHFD